MNKRFFRAFLGIAAITTSLFITSCYSVFSGGAGGLVVDAESTSNPKSGIANVDVYVYTDCQIRDSDFNRWSEGTVFSPSNTYYGHTTTDTDGSFVISNIVWKETNPDFGKDADYTTIYLLYYHENYGLIKGQTNITSDSTSDTVYAELTSIRKTTALNISIYDVSTLTATTNNVLVSVSVPQSTDTITASPKTYKQIISGTGIINVSYPRWKNAEDKADGIENSPEIEITYSQSADEITWKACANSDNAAQNYAFLEDDFTILKTIRNSSFNISLYGKATRLSYPTVNGTCGSANGEIVKMLAKDSSGNYTIDCGETTTYAQTVGTSGTQTNGNFSGLGSGYYWIDTTYTDRYSTKDVRLVSGGLTKELTLRSNVDSYTVSF
ncbi:MAG: hypothetical protein IIT58_06665 [Treponema sp.]|nr:hypothetical protein [Treponema sp.]